MIPQTDQSWQEESWQSALKNVITDPFQLCELLDIDPLQLDLSPASARQFPVKVPRSFVARMQVGDPKDPLLLQVLNQKAEESNPPGFVTDPLEEAEFNPLPGLIHKYKNRVLLTLSGACAIHCRYCFRRHFDYNANNPGSDGWLPVLRYLQSHSEIDEVIYSGGDPLSAPDRLLKSFTEQLHKTTRIKRLRVHSRMPVVIPQRITDECLEWLSIFENSILVTHINHPREIDQSLSEAIEKLKSVGVQLFNQAVLMRGINDDLETQMELHRKCFDSGIKPYYLHLMDPVEGAAHFDVPEEEAKKLYDRMRTELSGYMLPALSREIPGDTAKFRF